MLVISPYDSLFFCTLKDAYQDGSKINKLLFFFFDVWSQTLKCSLSTTLGFLGSGFNFLKGL